MSHVCCLQRHSKTKQRSEYFPSKACKTCLRQIASRTKKNSWEIESSSKLHLAEANTSTILLCTGQEEWRKCTRGNGKIRHSSLLCFCLIYNSVGKITEYIMNKFVCATGMFLCKWSKLSYFCALAAGKQHN